jgi:hypothetical protein
VLKIPIRAGEKSFHWKRIRFVRQTFQCFCYGMPLLDACVTYHS